MCNYHYGLQWRRKHPNGKSPDIRIVPGYTIWSAMKGRCLNPNNPKYPYYGGRGIKVCDRWVKSFKDFIEDMGDRPAGMSIDRIDVNGNYEPANCRWATTHQQAANKRNNTKYVGVRLIKYKYRQRWLTTLQVDRKTVLYEYHDTFDEAVKSRKEAERKWNITL